MLLKRSLIGIFRSFDQTGEKAKDPALKTRHYRMSKEQAWEEVVSTIKKMSGYKLLHEVKNVGEIVVEKKTMLGRVQDITVTVFDLGPNRTAIDIYSASRGSMGDFGSNYRNILELYRAFDRKLSTHKMS